MEFLCVTALVSLENCCPYVEGSIPKGHLLHSDKEKVRSPLLIYPRPLPWSLFALEHKWK